MPPSCAFETVLSLTAHLACQPCVYSVLCTAATQDFLDSIQIKEDQTLVFLTYYDLKSLGVISKQSNMDSSEQLLSILERVESV